jgi:hypothetical protein
MNSRPSGARSERAELYHRALHDLRGDAWRQWERAYLAVAPLEELEAAAAECQLAPASTRPLPPNTNNE